MSRYLYFLFRAVSIFLSTVMITATVYVMVDTIASQKSWNLYAVIFSKNMTSMAIANVFVLSSLFYFLELLKYRSEKDDSVIKRDL